MIDESKNIVFFGGAGVSTESGIQDFRSEDGLYRQHYDVPPEIMLSHTYFMEHPEAFFRFYKEKMLALDAKPNAAHKKLAELERAGKYITIVTQNIDVLHQAGGSKKVLELHGSVHRNTCMRCHRFFDVNAVMQAEGVPKCPCGGIIKPDVVLYEEGLDEETVSLAVDAISKAEMMIVAGTSLSVYPAAGMVRYFKGRHLVLINRDETPLDSKAKLVLHEKVGEVLSKVVI